MLRFHRFVNPHNAPSQSLVRTVFEYLVIIFGIFPMALMVNWVLLPHAFVGGGLTGICSAIYYVTGGLFDSRSHGRLAVLHPDDGRRCGNHVLVPRDTYPA